MCKFIVRRRRRVLFGAKNDDEDDHDGQFPRRPESEIRR